jgi:hypothetical protein
MADGAGTESGAGADGVALASGGDEVAAGVEHEKLEGWIPDVTNDLGLRQALEKAFDYRGDITLELKDGRVLQGYVFDRRSASSLEDSVVRLIPVDGSAKLSVSYADIRSLKFSGKDTAAGKSFESWVAKYWAKKAAGEKNIHIAPEQLD